MNDKVFFPSVVDVLSEGINSYYYSGSSGYFDRLFFVKDNFWSSDFPTTASSKFLDNFYTFEDATTVKLLKKKGYILVGKTALDEFACGGIGIHSSMKAFLNPWNSSRIAGGSSSGSALVVAKKKVRFSLGHDTGDSIRRPAAYCGVVGFKPSYGLISRFGIIPLASSLDTVGIIANSVETVKEVFKVIAKRDFNDLTTVASHYKLSLMEKWKKKKKIAIFSELEKYLDFEYRECLESLKRFLQKMGYEIFAIRIPPFIKQNLKISYLAICSSELVSHLASLKGVTFSGSLGGNSCLNNVRGEGLGKFVKERMILGAFFLEKKEAIKNAKKVRNWIYNWYKRILTKYDFLIFPTTINIAPLFCSDMLLNTQLNSDWIENLLIMANFSSFPSLSLKIGFVKKMPVSISLEASWGRDEALLRFGKMLEKFCSKKK